MACPSLARHSGANRFALQVADLIKRRKCVCPPEVVGTLLVLQLKDADPHAISKGQSSSDLT